MAASSMYAGRNMGNGTAVPILANGQVDINALIGNMLDRGVWDYYYTLFDTSFLASHGMKRAS